MRYGHMADAATLDRQRQAECSEANPRWRSRLSALVTKRRGEPTEGQEDDLPEGTRAEAPREAKMKISMYARVSKDNGQKPEMQLRELREYCARRGWEIAREYVDAGISGSKDKRPELDRLMTDAHRRKFDVVAVWKLAALRVPLHIFFGRSIPSACWASNSSRCRSRLDTATPAGRMVFTVLGAVGELERSLIVERVRAGLQNTRAKKIRLGRPRVVLDAARIGLLRAQGRSIRTIADELRCSRSLVHKSLAAAERCGAANAAD
jgi:DNA invertase Pin-like site-specific DNA recombinase